MKQGNKRVVSICLHDLPPAKMTRAGSPAKSYISLTIWDCDEPNHRDQDCVVQVTPSATDVQNGVPPLYVGGGLIHKTK